MKRSVLLLLFTTWLGTAFAGETRIVSMHDNGIRTIQQDSSTKTELLDKSIPDYKRQLEQMIAEQMEKVLEKRNLGDSVEIKTQWHYTEYPGSHIKTKRLR